MNGAEYIVEFLNKAGVEVCFGYPGGAVLTLYNALDKAEFEHILTGHEQGAVHAAEGYSRATGKTGVVFATSGPGATNIVTGIANAFLDSTPILAITGQVAANYIGRDSFQEADIQGITIPITKYNRLIKDVSGLPDALNLAWKTASEGRGGPVLLDITKNVFAAELPEDLIRWYKPDTAKQTADTYSLNKALEMIKKSKRPVILAGGGVAANSGASALLLSIMEKYKIPAVTTIMGKGAIPEKHEHCLGIVGMHGVPAANMALSFCDVLIAVGTRFSDRVIGNPEKYKESRKIIHVDIDHAELNKNIIADICINMESDGFLKYIYENLDCGYNKWFNDCIKYKNDYPMEFYEESRLMPQYVISEISKRIDDETPVITDVGQHQMFSAQYAKMQKPRKFITSGGLGTMGFGLPASVGAAIANKGKNAVLFVGDGGIQMTIQELATIKKYNLPVKIFVMDNACLGMVRQWQELFYNKFYSQSILNDNPNFTAIARGYGIDGMEICGKEEFDSNIDNILNENKPMLVHCHIPQTENVFPMVSPGSNPIDMIDINGEKIIKELKYE